ncbi:MAG: dihydrodipicolinate synthase family protein [Bryobacteraceae bacterium]
MPTNPSASPHGLYVAAVTPRRRGVQEIDLGATWDLIDFLCSHKVDGIVFMGTTGEFLHFSIEERIRLVSLAVKRSRVPIWINVSHSTLDGAVELANAATTAGAAGLLLMPPYYFRYTPEDILTFYRKFAATVHGKAQTLLYHIPVFNNGISLDVAAQLLQDGMYAGIKDSSGDWNSFTGLKRLYDEAPFALLAGDDNLFAKARTAGAPGGISGVASALPELLVALNRAVAAANTERVAKLDARLREFLAWLGFFPTPAGVKEAAILRGIKCGDHAVPFSPGQEAKREEFRAWFKTWLPVVQKECVDP